MAERLFVAWQDEASRSWHTIARLSRIAEGENEFVFTRGASRLRSIPHDLFKMEVGARYRSKGLLPLFANRMPSRSRGDYTRLAEWLNLTGAEDEFDQLAKFGMIAGSDSILVYPEPDIDHGQLQIDFFVHGVRHMPPAAQEWCQEAKSGTELLMLLDVQNPVDRCAVAIRTQGENILLGYVPAFYASDVNRLLRDPVSCGSAQLQVLKCNCTAPIQLRLLCRLQCDVPADFEVSTSEAHQPMVELSKIS